MNWKQIICMWLGIIVFVLVALNTKTHFDYGGGFDGPCGVAVDYGPLIARLVSTVIVACGLIYTLRDKKDNKSKDEQK